VIIHINFHVALCLGLVLRLIVLAPSAAGDVPGLWVAHAGCLPAALRGRSSPSLKSSVANACWAVAVPWKAVYVSLH